MALSSCNPLLEEVCAERYAHWRGPYAHWRGPLSCLHEGTLLQVPRRLSEHALQAHWFAGDFGRDFTTVDGQSVRIVQFGIWNHQPGPDFAQVAISFAGAQPIIGCVELDTDVRDWEHHGHASNPEYESVILHLFTAQGRLEIFTRTAQHRQVAQVLLDLTRLNHACPDSLPEAKPGRCIGPLRQLSEAKIRTVLLSAARYRLQRKAAAMATLKELHGADEALYQGLAAALGYKNNKLPFTLLAQRLPLKTLLNHRPAIEALLFGVSGFLSGCEFSQCDPTTRSYLRGLWEQWWPRRAQFERLTIPAALWKMGGQRPANHPQRRLAALAQIVRNWSGLMRMMQTKPPATMALFFYDLRDLYWEHHFTLSSKSSRNAMALVGHSRITEILVNLFFPLAKPEEAWPAYLAFPSAMSNSRVKVAAIRLFNEHPHCQELLKSAALQQGLLQLYEDFCMQDATDCANCPFPEQLAHW